MHPVVEIRQPGQPALFVSVRGPLEVGRECRGVLLSDPQVSRRHLSLDLDGERVIVEDLGSTNGSTIDGVRISGPTTLSAGRTVRCGETTIVLDAPLPPTTQQPATADAKGPAVAEPASDPTGTPIPEAASAAESEPVSDSSSESESDGESASDVDGGGSVPGDPMLDWSRPG